MVCSLVAGARVFAGTDGGPFESPSRPSAGNAIDQAVVPALKRLGVEPVLCSDAVFVRRVYLDVIGALPTVREAREFIEDTDADNKRRLLIDRLIERPEFADYWAMRWGDLLRIKAEFPVNLWPNAAQAYHHWVHAALAANLPYDRFARELLTSSGSNFRVGPVNFYRAVGNRTPEGLAKAVALTFMGARAEAWPAPRLAGMAVFFSQVGYKPTSEWKEEHVFWDPLGTAKAGGNGAPGRPSVEGVALLANSTTNPVTTPANPPAVEAVFPDGTHVTLSGETDPREVFADWLIQPKNPWFARNLANRVWAWLLGRGIIQEPDDIRDDNPPSNPALLRVVEDRLVASHYDLKDLYRFILNSATYQISSTRSGVTPEVRAQFGSYPLRRLDAEVLLDAINRITGSSDLYTSAIPEPFTYLPQGTPAVAIGDGSITSPFLALFGRPARATGLVAERNNQPCADQCLYLLNSADLQRKLEQGPGIQSIIGRARRPDRDVLDDLYLAILSRFPTAEEAATIMAYASPPPPKAAPMGPGGTNSPTAQAAPTNAPAAMTAATNTAPKRRTPGVGPVGSLGGPRKRSDAPLPTKKRDDWLDVAWSLITSDEFWYRH